MFVFCYEVSGYLMAREETHCRSMGYSFRLAARILLYASSHRQNSTHHGLWYTSRGALAGTRNRSMGSILRSIAPWADAPSLREFSLLRVCLEGFLCNERERNVLFNNALNTFYLRLYGVRHMVKDHSDSEKGNPLPPHRLLLSINSMGSFICTIPQTG